MSPRKNEPPLYVIAPNPLAGEFLIQVLARHGGMYPIPCHDLHKLAPSQSTTVFIIDNSFLLLPLTECLQQLRHTFDKGRFVVVDGAQSDDEIVRLLRLGIHGFVEHSEVAKKLVDATRTVARGNFWIKNSILQYYIQLTVLSHWQQRRSPVNITPRETQILELIRRSLTNKEIAQLLNVQECTVKYHVSNILEKLGVGSRHDLGPAPGRNQLWKQFLGTPTAGKELHKATLAAVH